MEDNRTVSTRSESSAAIRNRTWFSR